MIEPFHKLRTHMKSFQLAAAALLATTGMAIAQEKVQISYSGVVTVDHLSLSNLDGNYFYGNGDVNFRWSTVNSVKFGVDLGVETFGSLGDEFSDDLSAYYAAGVVEGLFGKLSIGMPRSVVSEYFKGPKIAGSELLDLDFGFFGFDLVRVVKLDNSDAGGELYGARYDGKFGHFNVAASVSHLSDFYVSDTSSNIEEIVAQYATGLWSVTLGTVLFEQEGISANTTSLEVQGSAGKFSGGIVYTKSDIFEADSIRGFVSYDVNEMIKLNTQVLHMTDGNSDLEFYSFDFSYKHKTGAFINAGVITGGTFYGPDDNIINLSLGYKF